MNTPIIEAPAEATSLLTKEQYTALRTTWKTYLETSNNGTHCGWHHLAYTVLREKNVDKAFPPAHTEARIASYAAQGKGPCAGLEAAAQSAYAAVSNLLWKIANGKAKEEENGGYALILHPTDVPFILDEATLRALEARLTEIRKTI